MTVLSHVWPLVPREIMIMVGTSNSYDPFTNTITFTHDVFNGQTTTAVAIAAHELAHASQNIKRFYLAQLVMAVCTFVLALVMPMPVAMLVVVSYFIIAWAHRIAMEIDASLVALRFIKKHPKFNYKIARLVLWCGLKTYLLPDYIFRIEREWCCRNKKKLCCFHVYLFNICIFGRKDGCWYVSIGLRTVWLKF
ncbi:MAG: hypothetical protein HOP30_14740 [Cyclobacteriaceae bacterium]|nr:hypothetical protein [Cyclobacteriaceae bacterium]